MLQRLFKPVDIAPLVFFRILAYLLMTTEVTGALFTRYWVDLTEPEFHFSYPFFAWVKPWPAPLLALHFLMTILAGICAVLGWRYRAAAVVFWAGLTSIFLMEASLYINHFYLYSLVASIMIFLPAHRALSLDAKRNPEIETSSAPAWTRQILLFQIGVVYFFAGVAKLEPDWIAARPMKLWLAARSHYPLIGGLLDEPWFAVLLSRGGLLFDLLIVPAMLWRRTRSAAFVVAILFHLTNVTIFGVGTFPWFSIVMTALFFPPPCFRDLPLLRRKLPAYRPVDYTSSISAIQRHITVAALVAYAVIQLVVPLRHFAYPGPTSWTEAGHRFSWRMMLRAKQGHLSYVLSDPATGRVWREDAQDHLTPHQYRALVGKPEMILQLAHFLAGRSAAQGLAEVEVRASSTLSLNGRPYQRFVRSDVNLTERGWGELSYDWLVPLRED